MAKTSTNNKFTFKYKFSDDYNPKYINGAVGGATSHGEIVANFFLERNPLPVKETYSINDSERAEKSNVEPNDLNKSAIRFIDTGIIMSLDTAKLVRDWLDRNIKTLEENLNSKP